MQGLIVGQRGEGTAVSVLVLGVGASWVVALGERIADDSYFYLVTARNLVLHGEHSFNRIVPTNGMHPLWLYVVTGWSWLVAQVDAGFLLSEAYAIPLSLGALGLALVGLHRLGRRLGVSMMPAMVVMAVYTGLFGVLCSEAHLSLAALVWFACAFVEAQERPSTRGALLVGFTAGLATLARLDSGVIGLASSAQLMRRPPTRRAGILALGGFVATVAPYLVWNVAAFGGVVPVSGWLKSNSPVPILRGLAPQGLATTVEGVSLLWGLTPLLFAGGVLRSLPTGKGRELLGVLWAAGVGQALYIGLFSSGDTSWYWYWTLDCLAGAVAFVLWIDNRWASSRQGPVRAWSLLALLAGLGLPLFAALEPPADSDPRRRAAAMIAAHCRPADAVLVSDYPGHVAFHHPERPVFAADLLTASLPLARALLAPGAGNALDRIQEAAVVAGRALRCVVVVGTGKALVADEDDGGVIFRHPRSRQGSSPQGRWSLGPPIAQDAALGWRVWKIPDPKTGPL